VAKDLENLKWENEVLELRFEKVKCSLTSKHMIRERDLFNIILSVLVSIRERRVTF